MLPARDGSRQADLESARKLARVLDDLIRIPGTNVRIGLDGIVGLIPVGGDLVTTALSLLILGRAARLGVPSAVLGRMAGNVALDAVVGAVPVLGDLFDFGFRANSRNARLLERYTESPEGTTRASKGAVVGALAVGVLALLASIAGVVFTMRWLAERL